MSPRKVTYSRKSTHAARAAHARGEKEFRTYDTSAIRPKKSKAPLIALIAAVAVVVVIIVALFVNTSCAEAANDHLAPDGQQVTVQIAEGSTLPVIADNLYDAGLVIRKGEFTAVANAKGAASSLKPGVYSFEGGMSNEDLVDALVAGPTANITNLVVPEGATLDSIATAVEKAYNGSITADQFKTAASDASKYAKEYTFLTDAGKNSLEGFLFPKTYELIVNASAEDVVRQISVTCLFCFYLYRRHFKIRVWFYCKSNHLGAVFRRSHTTFVFVRRMSGWNKPDFVQIKICVGCPSNGEMSIVYRIKGAA